MERNVAKRKHGKQRIKETYFVGDRYFSLAIGIGRAKPDFFCQSHRGPPFLGLGVHDKNHLLIHRLRNGYGHKLGDVI